MTYNVKYLRKPKQTTIMLHSADPKLTVNHVEWWLPVLLESKITFSVLVRDENNFKKLIQKYPFLQILYAKSPVDVETVVNAQPNLRVILYPTNRAKNIHLLRFIDYKHVFIGTKNSDWLSKINKSYRAYDEIWVSGNTKYREIINDLKELRHLKIVKVGKPQIKDRFRKSDKKVTDIVYLPALNENNSIFYDLLHNFDLDIKVKILNQQIENKIIENFQLIKNKNNFVFIKDKNIFEHEIINSDIIMCDFSNLDIWLFSYDKPIFVYLPRGEKFLHRDIPENVVTIFSSIKELILEENDNVKKNRKNFVEDTFGINETLNDMFIKQLNDISIG